MAKSTEFNMKAIKAIFVAIGVKAATRWGAERVSTQVQEWANLDKDALAEYKEQLGDGEEADLFNKVLKALKKGDVTIVKEETGSKKTTAKKETKKETAKPAVTVTDEEKEEFNKLASKLEKKGKLKGEKQERYDELKEKIAQAEEGGKKVGSKKTTAKKPAKKSSGPKAPGVIAYIAHFLLTATKKKPLSIEMLYAKLKEQFPGRDQPERMYRTIQAQVPSRIKKEKGLEIVSLKFESDDVQKEACKMVTKDTGSEPKNHGKESVTAYRATSGKSPVDQKVYSDGKPEKASK